MRWLLRIVAILAIVLMAVVVASGSWWAAPASDGEIRLIAHRGVHQTFSREGLTNDSCTASMIFPPEHGLLENTIASMHAAFDAGADIVELDVHPTTDGRFAVMHDWTLDCRSDGIGRTRDHDSATLKALDIGYGYTADGGVTYPFRGAGIGQMPMLDEVFATFPGRRFLVNFKSNDASEGPMLARLVSTNPGWRQSLWGVYGGTPPTEAAAAAIDGLAAWTRRSLFDCLGQYALIGWANIVPEPCRDTHVTIPVNIAPLLWGWPNLLLRRFRDAGSTVILLGPYGAGDPGSSGIDTAEQLAAVPSGFDGYLWTNHIERIGPLLGRAGSVRPRPQ